MKTNYQFFDRELSWLSFNARVLQEAKDENNPLIERVKFLGIFSNNQDEFYRVRVATISRMLDLHQKKQSDKVPEIQENLKNILKELARQQTLFNDMFELLTSELNKNDIYLINEQQLNAEQGEFVRSYFNDKVRQNLFPIMLKKFNSEDSLTDRSIYLAIILKRSKKVSRGTYAIVEIPTNAVGRFLVLPSIGKKQYIIMLDDVIRYCLDEIFSPFGYDEFTAYTFKFTRDAELDIDSDVSKSFLELMADSLEQRKRGNPLRFIHDRRMDKELLKALCNKFKITKLDQVVEGGSYHNFKDFMDFPNLGGKHLEYQQIKPIQHKDIPKQGSILNTIRKKDIMLHYPYQPFQYIVDLLREASIDTQVKSIKMTVYRLANPSNIINALINAARNGKSVTVFMELQARFDEQANILWSEKLQKEGVTIIQSIPGLKVHSKLILIERKEGNYTRRYANIGTGNFHEKTGALYSDDALLTSDDRITSEVEKVFQLFHMPLRSFRFRHLILSPFSTRNHFIRLLDYEIKNAKMGEPAWVTIKLNNLSDNLLIKKLYKASQAGVKINLIIRGICNLVPNVKGLSENIQVRSILDKYLEHSRVMIFCHGGEELMFISSADWMVRNLDNRIEVTTPIYNSEIKQELKQMLDIQLRDNCKARVIDSKMQNNYYKSKGKVVRTQLDTYNYLQEIHKH